MCIRDSSNIIHGHNTVVMIGMTTKDKYNSCNIADCFSDVFIILPHLFTLVWWCNDTARGWWSRLRCITNSLYFKCIVGTKLKSWCSEHLVGHSLAIECPNSSWVAVIGHIITSYPSITLATLYIFPLNGDRCAITCGALEIQRCSSWCYKINLQLH